MINENRLTENELRQIKEFVLYAKNASYGFVAFEVIRNSKLQEVFDYLRGNFPQEPLAVIDFRGHSHESPLQIIRQAAEKNPGCKVFFITNLILSHAATKEDEARFLQNINLFRDPLIALKKIFVFCFPPYFIDLLMSKAPDFWDFVPLKYEFLDAPPEKAETRSFDGEAHNQDYLKNQIRFLENALATYLLSDEERIEKMNELAEAYKNSYQWQKAVEKAKEAIELQENILSPEHPDLANSYSNLSGICQDMGNLPQALEFQLKSVKIREEVLAPDHPDLATAYNDLSLIYMEMGNLPLALEFQLKANGIYEKTLPSTHPWLATSYNNLSQIYQDMSNLPKAFESQLIAIEINEKVLSADHPDLATSYNNLSKIYQDIGNLPKALELQLKAIKIKEKVFSHDHPSLATSYNNLSTIFQDIGNLPQALAFQLKAIEIREKVLAPDHPDLAISFNNLCSIYYNLNEYKKAAFYINKTVEIFKKALLKEHPDFKKALDWQKRVYEKLGEPLPQP